MSVDFETKLKGVAIAFFNDRDEGYPFTHWREQAEELRINTTPEFIESVFNTDPEFYLDLAKSGGAH